MGFFGGLLGGSPKVKTTAKKDLGAEQRKARKQRVALFETEGGIQGEELQEGQVARRENIFGN